MLDLGAGAAIVLEGTEWTVERIEPQFGRVHLVDSTGARMQVSARFLANHRDCRPSTRTGAVRAAARGRQEPSLDDLTSRQRQVLMLRVAHLLEVQTGFRGGDPLRPAPGEPKPCYDPATTTLTERRRAKVAELAAVDLELRRPLALHKVSYRTLVRWEARRQAVGVIGCADDRWLRPASGHPRITEQVREAIHAVRAESLHRSRMSMRTKERLVHQYVREQFGTDALAQIPTYETLRVTWRDWFGPSGGRQRYVRSAAQPVSGQHVVVHRPGQVVALDTTVLPVKVRERVFGDPVSVHLTLALDLYTHSLSAFRLTLVSDSAVDVAMVLRDISMPLPMRPDWGHDMEWPYPGVPANIVADFAGYRVAGLPFFTPETVTTDHGSVYRNHHLVEVQRVLGANILPARILRPTDKQAVERAFGVIRSLLFEHLLGYTGVDVYDRGAAPEADATLTVDEMEHLIATWIVRIWQNRRLGEHAPSWGPGEDHSPNTLFAAAMEQAGFAMAIPSPQLYYQLLPAHHVGIDPDRGVKIRGLWYDGGALDPYRNLHSTRGGKHKGRWAIRRDPRDARTVFFQDPRTHDWHTLRWSGLPPEGEIASFNDARARDLLAAARSAGLKPRTDTELLPLLLDLLDAHVPVASWPTMAKAKRTEHARGDRQRRAARADQATATTAPPARTSVPEPVAAMKNPNQQSPSNAGHIHHAESLKLVSRSDKQRRRHEALQDHHADPPPLLGQQHRTRSLFVLADDDDDEPDPVHEASAPDEPPSGSGPAL